MFKPIFLTAKFSNRLASEKVLKPFGLLRNNITYNNFFSFHRKSCNYYIFITLPLLQIKIANVLSPFRYVVFMSMTWEDHGLRVLKKFAQDSITFSAMSETEKTEAFQVWTEQWDQFIEDMVNNI